MKKDEYSVLFRVNKELLEKIKNDAKENCNSIAGTVRKILTDYYKG